MLEVFSLLIFKSIKIFAVLHCQLVGDFRAFSYGVQKQKGNLKFVANLVSPDYVKSKNVSILGLFKKICGRKSSFFCVFRGKLEGHCSCTVFVS